MADRMFRRWKPPLTSPSDSDFVRAHFADYRNTFSLPPRDGSDADPHRAAMNYTEIVLAEGREGDPTGIYGPSDYMLCYRIFQVVTMGEQLERNWNAHCAALANSLR